MEKGSLNDCYSVIHMHAHLPLHTHTHAHTHKHTHSLSLSQILVRRLWTYGIEIDTLYVSDKILSSWFFPPSLSTNFFSSFLLCYWIQCAEEGEYCRNNNDCCSRQCYNQRCSGGGSDVSTVNLYTGRLGLRRYNVSCRAFHVEMNANWRSSEIQGTALGKCLRAWTCIYIYMSHKDDRKRKSWTRFSVKKKKKKKQ